MADDGSIYSTYIDLLASLEKTREERDSALQELELARKIARCALDHWERGEDQAPLLAIADPLPGWIMEKD